MLLLAGLFCLLSFTASQTKCGTSGHSGNANNWKTKIKVMKKGRLYFAAILFCLVVFGVVHIVDEQLRAVLTAVDHREQKKLQQGIAEIQEFMSNSARDSSPKIHELSKEQKELQNKIRVLCYVMTTPHNLNTKAVAVNSTWGRRCTKILFLTTGKSSIPGVVELDVIESRDHLTMKTVRTLEYLYLNHLNDYDWFLKADDDVYIIMENLKYLLSHHDSNTPVYMGHQLRLFTKQGYMSGGAGYIMSKEAVRVLNEDGFQKPKMCAHDGNDEDLDIGKCFDKIGVKPYSTVDKFGRQSFHPFGLHKAISGDYHGGEYYYIAKPYKAGKDCCSQLSISFHYVNPVQMFLIEMLLYNFNVYGRSFSHVEDSFFSKNKSVIVGKKPNEVLRTPYQFLFLYFSTSYFENSAGTVSVSYVILVITTAIYLFLLEL